jgi:hypothetical protein
MESSSAFFTICNIRDQIHHPKLFINHTDTSLHNYQIGLNPTRIKVYISAAVHPDSLDKGELDLKSDQIPILGRHKHLKSNYRI